MALLKKNFPGKKLIKRIFSFLKSRKNWEEIEYFDECWKDRIKAMALYIEANKSIVDLGCGQRWLLEYLPGGCTYIPVDYKKRSDDCIVADFNKKEYPTIKTNIAFISGCLEYINDYRWFLATTVFYSDTIILSYCTTEYFPDKLERKNNSWVNHLSSAEIIKMFSSLNCKLSHLFLFNNNTHIFVFSKWTEKKTI